MAVQGSPKYVSTCRALLGGENFSTCLPVLPAGRGEVAQSAFCCGPRAETSDHKAKCKFLSDIFKHPVLGLSEALRCVVLLATATCAVGCDEFCVTLMHCKAVKGSCVRLSIHPKMLLASYCSGVGLSHLGRGFDTLLLLVLGSCHSTTIN